MRLVGAHPRLRGLLRFMLAGGQQRARLLDGGGQHVFDRAHFASAPQRHALVLGFLQCGVGLGKCMAHSQRVFAGAAHGVMQRPHFDVEGGQRCAALVMGVALRQPLPAFGLARLVEACGGRAPVVLPAVVGQVAASKCRVQVGQQVGQGCHHLAALVFQRLGFGTGLRQRGTGLRGRVVQLLHVGRRRFVGCLRLVARDAGRVHCPVLLFYRLQIGAGGVQLRCEPVAARMFGRWRRRAVVGQQRVVAPGGAGTLQCLRHAIGFGCQRRQLFAAGVHGGALHGLLVDVDVELAAAARQLRLQAVQHALHGRIVVAVRVIVGAAHGARRVVGERGAQLFDGCARRGLRQCQRAFGLRQGGGQAGAFEQRGCQQLFGGGAGGAQLLALGLDLGVALLARVQLEPQLFGAGQQLTVLLPAAARGVQLLGIESGQRGAGVLAPRFQRFEHGGRCCQSGGGLRFVVAVGFGGALHARQLVVQAFGLTGGLAGLRKQHIPAVPRLRQGLPLPVLRQPRGAGFHLRLQAAPFILPCLQRRLGGSLGVVGCFAGGRGLAPGRQHRFHAGIERLGLVELRSGRALRRFRLLHLHDGLLLAGVRALQLQRGVGHRLDAGCQRRFGGGDVRFDAGDVIGQRTRRLHGDQLGERGAAWAGRCHVRSRPFARLARGQFVLLQLFGLAMPAQFLFQVGLALFQHLQCCGGGHCLRFDLRAFVGGERLLVGQAGVEFLQRLLFELGALEGAHRNLGVDGAAGEGFQQFAALVVFRLEEGGKLVLRQQHGARKLLERQTDAAFDLAFDFGLGGADRLQRGQQLQGHGGRLQRAFHPCARAAHAPARAVRCAVVADKVHFGVAVRRAAPQQRARILGGDRFAAHVGQHAAPRHLEQPWRVVVQCQAQGVEQGALAGAGGTADGEQPGGGERLLLEVHRKFPGQRRQVFTADAQNSHGSINSAKALS